MLGKITDIIFMFWRIGDEKRPPIFFTQLARYVCSLIQVWLIYMDLNKLALMFQILNRCT